MDLRQCARVQRCACEAAVPLGAAPGAYPFGREVPPNSCQAIESIAQWAERIGKCYDPFWVRSLVVLSSIPRGWHTFAHSQSLGGPASSTARCEFRAATSAAARESRLVADRGLQSRRQPPSHCRSH
eukprot:5894341-Prymnesium_polylepis.4